MRAEDVVEFYKFIKNNHKFKVKIVITLSRNEYDRLQLLYPEILSNIKNKVLLMRDTCLIVSPFGKSGKMSVATNSFKAYFYLKRRGLDVYLADLRELASLAHGD